MVLVSASMAWVMASSPVVTVMPAGSVRVKRGSRMAAFGMMWLSTRNIFLPTVLLVSTATLVTSLPVPAVVGMQTWGVCGPV